MAIAKRLVEKGFDIGDERSDVKSYLKDSCARFDLLSTLFRMARLLYTGQSYTTI